MITFLYPIAFLVFIPTLFGAPTMRPRQFPTGGFPTMDFDFPTDMTMPDFTGFDTSFPSFTGFDTSFPDFSGFDTKFPSFTGFDTHWPWPTGFPTTTTTPPASTSRPTTTPAADNASPTSTGSTPDKPQDGANPSASFSSSQSHSQSQSPPSGTSGTSGTVYYNPFDSWDSTPHLTFGAIIGIVFGCIGGFTLLFVLYYMYHQHMKEERALERQLAYTASSNNNNNRESLQRPQNTTTTASAEQQTEFNYGAHYQPYQPYREQSPSPQPRSPSYPAPTYASYQQPPPTFPVPEVTTGHAAFESYTMTNMPDHRQQTEPTASGNTYPPAPPYEQFVPKPDAVASPTMSATTTAAAAGSSLPNRIYNGNVATDKPHSRT